MFVDLAAAAGGGVSRCAVLAANVIVAAESTAKQAAKAVRRLIMMDSCGSLRAGFTARRHEL